MQRFKGFFDLDIIEESTSVETFRFTEQIPYYGSTVEGQTYSFNSNSTKYRWVAKDLPGLKIEPYTDNIINYLGTMHFELIRIQFPRAPVRNYTSSWDDANEFILDNDGFGEYIAEAGSAWDHYMIDAPSESIMESILWALNTARENISWNQRSSVLAVDSPENVLRNGSGNSAEVNLLLLGLLRNLEIEAYPVVLSTVDNGRLFSDSPTITQWNYVVVLVKIPGEDDILLDATANHPIPGYLPQRAINGRGRTVDKNVSHWVDLESNILNKQNREYDILINNNGDIQGSLKIEFYDFGKYIQKQKLKKLGEQEYIEKLSNDLGFVIENSEIEWNECMNEPMVIEGELNVSEYAQVIGNELIMPSLLFETTEENIFRKDERLYPVYFNSTLDSEITFNIELEDNLDFAYIPEDTELRRGMRFIHKLSFKEDGNKLHIIQNNVRNRRVVPAENYNGLKQFYNRKIDNLEQIVLKIK